MQHTYMQQDSMDKTPSRKKVTTPSSSYGRIKRSTTIRKRSSYRRKMMCSSSDNFAEARKEIAKVLHLHNRSNSSFHPTTSTSNNIITTANSHYPLVAETLPMVPVHEPTWSTTPPSTVVTAASNPAPPSAVYEASDGNSSASECTDQWGTDSDENDLDSDPILSWWVGFLKSLDGRKTQLQLTDHLQDHHYLGQASLMLDSNQQKTTYYHQLYHEDVMISSFVNGSDDQFTGGCILDEGLVVPNAADALVDELAMN